ncbi:type I restriction endonuclease subunit R [Aureispira anguillae]|uniref:Type I restriction enzyme endonuclease subunit n=1 Tax=Aureispira anguillae TaxID=2864201 RepID=A0A915YGG5_9BACT|nr:type I restriction endonuclease subunit R [Aureispira anguillae]BDS12704.1 type I restriction endonuclease subunit R [Aureispira anguillae]
MAHQPEQILEDKLVAQLKSMSYSIAPIRDEASLLSNLKKQLETFNQVQLSETEFKRVLNHLNKGNVFKRAKILRDKVTIARDNGDTLYLSFIDAYDWSKNLFQVTQQVSMEGKYKTRYDVTLLVNGLPLVQIELKRRGLEMKEAFNQINRYQRHSYGASEGLFLYVQIFVISNGINTKYFANNKKQTFKQTFYWADEANKRIHRLEDFTAAFLEPAHLSKMLTQYIVLNEGLKILMVLRPYQYYATEAIIQRVKDSTKNGYIWHTTGSGKTLTSFKASQILTRLPQVHKVIFVVDRKDLDYQTMKEFNNFSKGSVDGTDNTKKLVTQFTDDTQLIVTTIQKLNNAIEKQRYLSQMEGLKNKRLIFIFDECHRSQFGQTHLRIKNFFKNSQLFGFTGTPIFAKNAIKNALGKRTTAELFEKCLHKYIIVDAIKDENVLKFSIEYVGRYREKEGSKNEIDIEVEDIDTKELLESPERLEKIADYILANHARKTHNRQFTAMFCVSSIDTLISYYELFKAKREAGQHDLKVATIFSYGANEKDRDADGFYTYGEVAEPSNAYKTAHHREKLDAFIEDYNQYFNTSYNTKDSKLFYNYYKDISQRVKNGEIDLLLVVNMFLTGFDSPRLNTLFVDKNLKYHGLIQAYSRTNRIIGDKKSQGNIVVFRNLKKATDNAIELFSNKDAKEVIIMQPYENYVEKFNAALEQLKDIAPTVDSVHDLPSEDEELEFVKAFRELMRVKNTMSILADFSFEDLDMGQQEFEDYKSQYLDIYQKTQRQKEKVSILDDVDFALELIHRDDVNVAYILRLLAELQKTKGTERGKKQQTIIDLLSGEIQLRSKKELIEKFILENLPNISNTNDIPTAFEEFWNTERRQAFANLCEAEQLKPNKLQELIDNYMFTGRVPLVDAVVKTMEVRPKLLQFRKTGERVLDKVLDFVERFFRGV